MRRPSPFALLAALCALTVSVAPAAGERLVASLSNHRVMVTSNFTGEELVLFGGIEQDAASRPRRAGYDIVVTVTGPRQTVVTFRKARALGIWVNADSRVLEDAPAYLAVLSNRPLDAITNAETLRRLQLGLDNIPLPQRASVKIADAASDDPFRVAFIKIKSDQGLYDTLKAAGLQVDYIEISAEVDHDSSLAVPIITAYIQKHPDLKAIGTQHGNVTAFIGKALKDAGKKPGDITVGGIDLSPATIDGLKKGYISVTLDQQLYLQGFLPVMQCVLSKKYGFAGLSVNTGAGVVTPKSIGALMPLIDKGIR